MIINETNMVKIAINKSILKEYRNSTNERVVYLDNNSEFQIQLYNPTDDILGAKIEINGKSSEGLILVRPGERIWLERPIGVQRKFVFETYMVDKSSTTRSAIKNNGLVSVKFYREDTGHTDFYCGDCNINTTRSVWLTSPMNISYKTLCSCDLGIGASTTATSTYYADSFKTAAANTINNSAANSAANTVETGRITYGKKSNQKFNEVDYHFSTWSSYQENIKLLPISDKPYTNSDLQKKYCTECGRKLNNKFKYCPHCGTKCQF